MLRLVPVSIVMAGAALEANANEIVQDILDATGKAAGLEITKGQRQLLRDWKEDRSGNSLANYRGLAHLLDKDPQTGDAVWEPARHLVEFRNLFMHFKPAWNVWTRAGAAPRAAAKWRLVEHRESAECRERYFRPR
jgi:hypothetical protein